MNKKITKGLAAILASAAIVSCTSAVPKQKTKEYYDLDIASPCQAEAFNLADYAYNSPSHMKKGIYVKIPDEKYARCVDYMMFDLTRDKLRLIKTGKEEYFVVHVI